MVAWSSPGLCRLPSSLKAHSSRTAFLKAVFHVQRFQIYRRFGKKVQSLREPHIPLPPVLSILTGTFLTIADYYQLL